MTSTYPAAPAVCEIGRLDEVSELARPVAAANERLRHIVEALKAERARAVGDLRRAVLNLGHDCPPERRVELARVLYWRHTDVAVGDITAAFGFHDQAGLLTAIGPVASGVPCEDCRVELPAGNRRRLSELRKIADNGPARYGPRALCRRCDDRRERAAYSDPPDETYDDDQEPW